MTMLPALLPAAPVLVAGVAHAAWGEPGSGAALLPLAEAAGKARRASPLLCHARASARRLGVAPFPAYDVLELFAFVRPARFCLPTPRGLAAALGLPAPADLAAEAETVRAAAGRLLAELAAGDPERRAGTDRRTLQIAWAMTRGGWTWGPAVLAALGAGVEAPHSRVLIEALAAWKHLKEWSEHAPEPPAGHLPVEPVEARARLVRLLGDAAEERPQQRDYASAVAAAFAPREHEGEPRLVLAEAGTGVGKTLGYIAPASVWAEKNQGPVWISTFTKNLQRQLDAELDRLYPDRADKALKVVVRKGRENYLCLLNMDEAVHRLPQRPEDAVALGLMARWTLATRDGDMVGGDFPAWLIDLLGRRLTVELTDTRGECIYAACTHYRKCFIERTARRARRAAIVVANHALVMVQAANGGDDAYRPTRLVFDEGHHVFDAADGAFSAHLTGLEAAELRRWLLGAEAPGRSRARGLQARIGELVAASEDGTAALAAVLAAARVLPASGWQQRLGGQPLGPTEDFLVRVRQQVHARSERTDGAYSLEAETAPPVAGLVEAAAALESALAVLEAPARALVAALFKLLGDEAADLDTATRMRIEAAARGLERRAVQQVQAWRAMLKSLGAETPAEFVDWFGVERIEGREIDVGMYRHWADPMRPFAETVLVPAHGALVTSATLRDATGDDGRDWEAAEIRTGTRHAGVAPTRVAVPSPFDYGRRTRVFIVTDVAKGSADAVAAAYRELFLAAAGGGLGLFTAIARLRAVHARIAAPLEEAGLPLYAQHVDALDTGTLIDIFRAEENACLLGTDAVRDGVDVPGRSLRLIVFDRVPWPRADILHKARRAAFGTGYDDMLTRLRLKQAFGRLIRKADDVGVFVMLDPALPSRLLGAFPPGVAARRVGLAEAVAGVREFLGAKVA
jgi:ATP-dependent DNA helicase DinG